MIVSSDIDPSPQPAPIRLVLISQTGARGLKLVLAVIFTVAVFICQENIHALLSRVHRASLSDYLSAPFSYVCLSQVSGLVVMGFRKISFCVTLLECFLFLFVECRYDVCLDATSNCEEQ